MDAGAPSLTGFKFLPCESTPPPHTTGSPPQDITLHNSSFWTYCGPLLPLAPAALPPSFHAWARATVNGSLLPSLLPFLSFVHSFLARAGLSHYWLTIRAIKATHEFDRPRWHTDDEFFDQHTTKGAKGGWKLVTTLLGPGTLFVEDGAGARVVQRRVKREAREAAAVHACTSIRCAACAATSDVVRTRLAEALRGYRVVQAAAGECAFLRIGEQEGAVHSEPPCHGDRVFVNVVPGTEQELRDLMAKWGMEFPRAWSIGVPLFGDN